MNQPFVLWFERNNQRINNLQSQIWKGAISKGDVIIFSLEEFINKRKALNYPFKKDLNFLISCGELL